MRRVYRLLGFVFLLLLSLTLTECPGPPHQTLYRDGIEFAPIPAGTFTMGAPAAEAGSRDFERPVHSVTIQKSYYLSRKEITQGDWLRVMGPVHPYDLLSLDERDEDMPMTCISWFDAKAFAEALERRNPPSKFRLPTEAEWEHAARGGNTSRFYWGDDFDLSKIDQYAWTWRNSGGNDNERGHVQKGAQLIPNSYGLYDMSGNLSEWVEDRYHENYNGAPSNGSAWGTPEFIEGVDEPLVLVPIYGLVRGGNCNWYPEDARSASRFQTTPNYGDVHYGFRILLQLSN